MTRARPTAGTPAADDSPTQELRVVPAPRHASGPGSVPADPASFPADPASVPADPAPDPRRAPDRRNGLGTPALALGLLAAGTCWTGWAGVVLGLFGVVAGSLGARRAFHGLATDGASSLGGLVLGGIGLVVGVVVVWPTLFGTGNFGDGLTLDQCLTSSTTAKEMHMCKSQHLAEYNQRYPPTEG